MWSLILGLSVACAGLHDENVQATGVPSEEEATATGPAMVVVVRHAEKAAGPEGDPTLSEAGTARAEALGVLLAAAQPTRLWATHLQRTQLTLAPLARATGLEVEVLPAGDTAALIEQLLERRDRLAVVAGHSNTVPDIVRGLGASFSEPELGDDQYGRIFVVTLVSAGESVALVELRY